MLEREGIKLNRKKFLSALEGGTAALSALRLRSPTHGKALHSTGLAQRIDVAFWVGEHRAVHEPILNAAASFTL